MSVHFVPRLDKANQLENGKFPIILQITWGRKVRKKRLGLSATFEQWDFNNHEFKKSVHSRAEYNRKIEEEVERAKKIYNKHFEDVPFNFLSFVQYFDIKKEKTVSVLEFCEQVRNSFIKTGQIAASIDYECIKSAIAKVAPNDLEFTDIDKEWLEKFESFFHERGANCSSYMKTMKSLYGKAVEKRIVDVKYIPFKNPYTNPFGYDTSHLKKVKIKRINKGRIKDLSETDLIKLMNYKPQSYNEQKYLDLWFLSYYLFGVNFTDIAMMENKDIKDDRWHYERSKTGVGLKLGKPLVEEAQAIIAKYRTNGTLVFDILEGCSEKGIPYNSSPQTIRTRIQDYVKYISKTCKKVSAKIGLDGYFTYYSARHTSATIALNKGAEKNTVSKLMDHSDLSTLDYYAGNADDMKVKQVMELLRLNKTPLDTEQVKDTMRA